MEHAYGLYTHIRSNARRSIALLIGLFLLVYVMVFAGALLAEGLRSNAPLGWMLASTESDFATALPWATGGTALWVLIAYRFHQNLIDAVTGGREVTRRDEPRLWNLLENLCISRGITMPRLKVMDSPALNAFATGLNQKQYAVTVTNGLLQALDDAELEAVLGHELTHIRNGDVRLLVIAVVIAGVISFFAELIVRMFFQSGLYWGGGRRGRDDDRKGSGTIYAILIAVALVAVSWILSIMIRFALSRSREYLADAGSVELTKNPDAMIAALRKIEGRGDIERANSAVMEMCVDNPREDFADLFDTHPSIESRIEKLVRFAGGHDPGPIALAAPAEVSAEDLEAATPEGPWSAPEGGQRPALPPRSAIDRDDGPARGRAPSSASAGDEAEPSGDAGLSGPWGSGPWGPHQGR